jgi:hypothetical protein
VGRGWMGRDPALRQLGSVAPGSDSAAGPSFCIPILAGADPVGKKNQEARRVEANVNLPGARPGHLKHRRARGAG